MILTNDDFLDIERELCSRSFANFVKRAWPVLEPSTELKWGWAVEAICEHLEAVHHGDIKRLLMNVPPGSMKSMLVGVMFPAWEWGPKGKPAMRYLGTAHKQDLAVRDNLKCRRLITSPWYQSLWGVTLTGDQNAKTKFENSSTGFREAMAFTSMTGARGDRVLLDDPHSVDDANSPAHLESANTTFREALPSRVNNADSAIIIIMQRLHENDVSNHALGLGYDHLVIPMRYEGESRSKTALGWVDPRTEHGELMFPERFNEQQVKELEDSLLEYATAGQLQQRPAPRQGGTFKPDNIEIVDALPSNMRFVRGWDLAATKGGGDATAGVKLCEHDGTVYIADVRHDRGSPDEVEKMLVSTSAMDGSDTKQSIPQDPGQAGKSQAAYLSKKLKGINFTFSTESGDKATRAGPIAAQINIGNVKMLRGDWNDAFISELRVFPNGKNDDRIDGLSRAYNELALGTKKAGVVIPQRYR